MYSRQEGFFKGFGDFELFYQSWTVSNPVGTLVVTHGLGEHSECYQRFAEGLSPSGFNIFAWDLRGHGKSEGKRGVVEGFSSFSKDLAKFVEFLKPQIASKPFLLVGHSMGGLVLAQTLIDIGNLGAKAAVFSSPLFGISAPVPPLKEKVGRMVAGLLPNLTLYSGLKYEDLTRDRDVVKEYEKDTYRHERISTSLFVQMTETMQMAMTKAGSILLPVFLQQAGMDKIVSASAATQFFSRLGSKDKELIVYDEYYHEIFNDVGREKVFSDLNGWLKKWI